MPFAYWLFCSSSTQILVYANLFGDCWLDRRHGLFTTICKDYALYAFNLSLCLLFHFIIILNLIVHMIVWHRVLLQLPFSLPRALRDDANQPASARLAQKKRLLLLWVMTVSPPFAFLPFDGFESVVKCWRDCVTWSHRHYCCTEPTFFVSIRYLCRHSGHSFHFDYYADSNNVRTNICIILS